MRRATACSPREGVTEAARKLQLDRPRLETLVCECYEVVHRETERLFSQKLPAAAKRSAARAAP